MAESTKAEGGQIADHRDGREVVLRLRGIRTQFGEKVIHNNLDFDVFKGEIVGLVGGSGTGKSVLLKTIIGLNEAREGRIEMLGVARSRARRSARCWRARASSSRTARCSPP
jgi:phospholipid/cholesterol/gamma-HCH transport system ATP-binding protein